MKRHNEIQAQLAAIRDELDRADLRPDLAIGSLIIAVSHLTDLVEQLATKQRGLAQRVETLESEAN